ncbi:MAG: hypothetical protein LAT67_05565 [Balneolales bacterium]|nr:hypothetical protein [Balneolales bacterium]
MKSVAEESKIYHVGKAAFAEQKADVFVAGIGTVGGELLNQLETSPLLQKEYRLIGFCNSKLALLKSDGLRSLSFSNSLFKKQPVQPTRWNEIVRWIINHRKESGRNVLFVDATGSREVALLYVNLLKEGVHVVTPSKLANTMPQSYFDELVAKRPSGSIFKYEAAAGAGLPVVSTIESMVNNGDEIQEISGVLSGTMTYLFGQLEKGVLFSDAVRKAYDNGYTEPDPRDDLSGEDVARKCLILARTAGFKMERESFKAEDQTPDELKQVSLDDFFNGLKNVDAEWSKRVADQKAKGKVLRYIGTVRPDGIRVGVQAVDSDSPLGTLKGADNMISIRSRYYSQSPITIQGPGAGKEVTAQGVLADMRYIILQTVAKY